MYQYIETGMLMCCPWKALLDGLVHAGLLMDDTARWCRLGDLTFRRGEATSTTIILEDTE